MLDELYFGPTTAHARFFSLSFLNENLPALAAKAKAEAEMLQKIADALPTPFDIQDSAETREMFAKLRDLTAGDDSFYMAADILAGETVIDALGNCVSATLG